MGKSLHIMGWQKYFACKTEHGYLFRGQVKQLPEIALSAAPQETPITWGAHDKIEAWMLEQAECRSMQKQSRVCGW